jgi:hypothetical protein
MPLTKDPDPDPAIFSLTFKTPTKTKVNFFLIFRLLLFEGTLTSFIKDKKSKRGHKTVRIKVFLTIFA